MGLGARFRGCGYAGRSEFNMFWGFVRLWVEGVRGVRSRVSEAGIWSMEERVLECFVCGFWVSFLGTVECYSMLCVLVERKF